MEWNGKGKLSWSEKIVMSEAQKSFKISLSHLKLCQKDIESLKNVKDVIKEFSKDIIRKMNEGGREYKLLLQRIQSDFIIPFE